MCGRYRAVSLLLAAAVLVLAPVPTPARAEGAAPAEEPTSFYDLRVSFDPQGRILRGEQRVSWPNRTGVAQDEVHFVLRANLDAEPNPHLGSAANAAGYARGFDPAWTKIDAVRDEEGRPLAFTLRPELPRLRTYSLEDGFLVVRLPRALLPGETATFTISFRTRVPARQGDAGMMRGELTWRFGWFPQERYWDPVRGAWSEGDVLCAFRHRLDLVVPEALMVAVGADWCAEARQGGERLSRCGSDVPVRSIPLLFSSRWVPRTAEVDGVQLTVLAQPDGDVFDRSATEAATFLELAAGILRFYNERFGPYRLHKLVIAESPQPGMSMAADGLLLLSDYFWIYNSTWVAWGIYDPVAEATLAHELAHLWWGIGVGADLDRANWLSEAFAQYLSFRYMTEIHGADADTLLRPNAFLRWVLGSAGEVKLPRRQVEEVILPDYRYLVEDGLDSPISAPASAQKDLGTASQLYYEKGYLVLRSLELFMPVQTVQAVLREAHRRHAGKVATIDDLQRVAEELSGVKLDRLFAGWVHGTASGDYAIERVQSTELPAGGGWRHEIALSYTGSGALPVPLQVTDRAGHVVQATWDPAEGSRTVRLDTPAPLRDAALDPQGLAPDVHRRNNFQPRRSSLSWLVARNDPEAYVYTVKPTRLSRFGTLGPALGGSYLDDHQWWVGAGLGGAISPLDGEEDGGALDPASGEADLVTMRLGAYAESSWRLGRANALLAGLGASTAGGTSRRFDGRALLGWGHTVWTAPELGLSAPLLLPQLQLAVTAGPHYTRELGPDGATEELASGELSLELLRDDSPTLGLIQRLTLTGGGHAPDGLATYGLARWDASQLSALGPLGYLTTRLAAGVQSESTPTSLRFVADLSPTAGLESTPARGGWMAQASLLYTLPLLRQLRIKNPLTLWLAVFNGLDLDLQYTAAALALPGHPPDSDTAVRLGEAHAALTAHLALFDGQSFGLRLGWATPCWPAAWDPAAGRLTVNLVMVPHAL